MFSSRVHSKNAWNNWHQREKRREVRLRLPKSVEKNHHIGNESSDTATYMQKEWLLLPEKCQDGTKCLPLWKYHSGRLVVLGFVFPSSSGLFQEHWRNIRAKNVAPNTKWRTLMRPQLTTLNMGHSCLQKGRKGVIQCWLGTCGRRSGSWQ